MTDHTKLKALALAATRTCPVKGAEIAWFTRYETFTVEHADDVAYIVEANPAAVLAIIAENEALRQANLDCVNHFEVAMADIDALRTQVAELSKDAERYKSALREHIRMYRVDDQAYDPDKETTRLLAIAIDEQKGKV